MQRQISLPVVVAAEVLLCSIIYILWKKRMTKLVETVAAAEATVAFKANLSQNCLGVLIS